MSKMMVVVFDDEAKAYEATRAMRELHREGSITVYGAAVIARDADGKLTMKDEVDEGPIGTAVGMLTGGLIGLLAGPQGMVIGAAAGGMMGATADLINLGVGTEFLNDVAAQLAPGKVALVGEVSETWVTPVDSRMEALGGMVYRRFRDDVEDEQIERDIEATRADIRDLKAEYKATQEENKAKLQAKIDAAEASLKAAGDRAEAKIDSLEAETDAKIKAIDAQIATAKEDTKEKLETTKAEIKSDYETRTAKLKQAWDLTKEAVAV